MTVKRVKTVCPYCGTGCTFYLKVHDGKITKTIPYKGGAGQGKLCIKGHSAHEFIHSDKRLTKPMIRDRKEGPLREASWDEALDLVVKKLKEISNEYGSNALGFLSSAKCTNEANYVMQKLARAVWKTNNVDHCARLCHASTVAGLVASFGSGAMTNSIDELEHSDVIFITGSNTTEQHPLIGNRILRNIRQKGGKLIVADPRLIDLAKLADVFIQQRPGTDVAMLNGMMNIIINENLYAKDFVENHAEGFDEFKKVVEKYTPEKVEKITTIPADKLREAAYMYSKANTASIIYSMGITQHTTGVDNVRSCANLAILTGNVGKESTGVNPLRGQNNVQGACDLGALSNVFSGYQRVDDAVIREKMGKAWNVTDLPGKVGLTVVEQINAAYDGQLKGIYIMGENPMISDPDINHVKQALQRLPFLVVQDIFLTETAELADVVLPGTSFAEIDGTYTNTERRIIRLRKAIESIGDSRPDWWIVGEIAKRAGYDGLQYNSASEIMDEVAKVTPIYGGISYSRLDNAPQEGLQWPCPDFNHPGTKFLHKDGKFSRGKGLFGAIEYKPPDEVPDDEYPYILTTGRILFHWHTGTMTRKSPTLETQAPTPFIELNEEDAVKLNLKDDEKVRVISRRGEILIPVWISDRVPPGTVFIPFHFEEAAANILTNPALDPIAKIPEFKVCAVNIVKNN